MVATRPSEPQIFPLTANSRSLVGQPTICSKALVVGAQARFVFDDRAIGRRRNDDFILRVPDIDLKNLGDLLCFIRIAILGRLLRPQIARLLNVLQLKGDCDQTMSRRIEVKEGEEFELSDVYGAFSLTMVF